MRIIAKPIASLPLTLVVFVAGIVLSAATNLYTNYLFVDTTCGCFHRVVTAAVLLLIGATCLSVFSWILQDIENATIRDAPVTVPPEQRQKDKIEVVEAQGWKLTIPLVASVVCIVAGLVVLSRKDLDQVPPTQPVVCPVPTVNSPVEAPHSK